MIDRTDHQIAGLIELQEAHEQRLRVLMLRSAQSGIGTAPEIIIEAQNIQDKVLAISAEITKLQIRATKAENREYIARNTNELADVSLQLSSSTETIRRIQQDMLQQLIGWNDDDAIARRQRQRVTTIFYVVVIVMLAIDIGLRFVK